MSKSWRDEPPLRVTAGVAVAAAALVIVPVHPLQRHDPHPGPLTFYTTAELAAEWDELPHTPEQLFNDHVPEAEYRGTAVTTRSYTSSAPPMPSGRAPTMIVPQPTYRGLLDPAVPKITYGPDRLAAPDLWQAAED